MALVLFSAWPLYAMLGTTIWGFKYIVIPQRRGEEKDLMREEAAGREITVGGLVSSRRRPAGLQEG